MKNADIKNSLSHSKEMHNAVLFSVLKHSCEIKIFFGAHLNCYKNKTTGVLSVNLKMSVLSNFGVARHDF